MKPRLLRLELEGFRGFAGRQVLDLDADVILARGDNGTGKTSVADGLLWLFTGELAHLVERVRGLRRVEDEVKNRFNDAGASVALVVDVAGTEATFTRQGNARATTLMVERAGLATVTGAAAEQELAEAFGSRGPTDFRQAVTTWGLLRQDAIRAALEVGNGALHERLSGLVGLEEVSGFAASASQASAALVRERTVARRLRDAAVLRHGQASERLRLARAAADAATDRSKMLAESLSRIGAEAGLPISLPEAVSIDTVTRLGSTVSGLVEALTELVSARQELLRYPKDVEAIVRAADAAVGQAETAVAASAERAPAVIQMATSAMGLLGERCPVCNQEIDTASVRAHLEEVLAESRELAVTAQKTQDDLIRAQAELARVRGALAERRRAEDRERAAESAAREMTTAMPFLDLETTALDDRLLEALSQLRYELRELYREVNRASGAETLRVADEVEEARLAADTAQRRVDELDARCQRAKKLERAATRAAETILARALEELQPSFAEVFDRLAPNPAFTRLSVRQDVMRNRNQIMPVVTDLERGIDANPSLVFSDGQLNTVALSYFLGMALNAKDAALPFLILDDPLQSFDVVAILGFSDLCRHIREHRQLLITTHDRRFADVLERKLSPREPGSSLVVHDFAGWSREGPTVRTSRPEMQPVLRLLREAS